MYRNSPNVNKPFKSPVVSMSRAAAVRAGLIGKRVLAEPSPIEELAFLQAKESELNRKIGQLEPKDGKQVSGAIAQCIEKLHEYNEVKDVAQRLLGISAVNDGISFREAARNYNAPESS